MGLKMIQLPRYHTLTVLLSLLLLTTSVSIGQEIGLEYGLTRAGYDNTLERPTGFGGHLEIPVMRQLNVPLLDQIAVRFSASRHTEEFTEFRSMCTGWAIRDHVCFDEAFNVNSNIIQYGLGVVLDFESPVSRITPKIYAMGIRTTMDSKYVGRDSDTRLHPLAPDKEMGAEFGGSINYRINPYISVSGRLGVQPNPPSSCYTDAWDAFCNTQGTMLRYGISTQLLFPGLR